MLLLYRNGVCVFELATGMPLLRHWADTGGGPIYYGALPASVLVVRAISAVYNYDYVQASAGVDVVPTGLDSFCMAHNGYLKTDSAPIMRI